MRKLNTKRICLNYYQIINIKNGKSNITTECS